MLILFIVSVALMAVFLIIALVASGGVPVSFSSVYYALERNGWVFQALIIGIAATLLPVWLSVSDVHQWMAFIACGGLMFVGAAPAFRIPLYGMVHYSAAILCCASAIAWQVFSSLWDVTLWFGMLGGMASLMWKEKWCWWVELAVMGSVVFNIIRIW